MNNKQLSVIGVAVALAIVVIAINITGITGQATKSKVFVDGASGQIELNEVTYTISNVDISKSEWVTFTISSNQSPLEKEISGEQNSKYYINPEIGPAIVHITYVKYNTLDPKKSNAKIVLITE